MHYTWKRRTFYFNMFEFLTLKCSMCLVFLVQFYYREVTGNPAPTYVSYVPGMLNILSVALAFVNKPLTVSTGCSLRSFIQ